MRAFSRISAVLLLLALVSVAGATKINILDPFATYPVLTSPFTVSFSSCQTGELPVPGDPGFAPLGCFAAVNSTGGDWSAVELVIPDFGHSFQCDTDDASQQYFPASTCIFNAAADQYELTFSRGLLGNSRFFVITEDDIDPALFPAFNAYVTFANGAASATPEPPAALLLLTGLLATATLVWARQRRLLWQP